MNLTDEQLVLLRGLVARAAEDEQARVARMKARPRGSHTPKSIMWAERLAQDLAELEKALA